MKPFIDPLLRISRKALSWHVVVSSPQHSEHTAFFSGFPLDGIAESPVKAFFRLFLWNFKEKGINLFLGHGLKKASIAYSHNALP